MAKFSSNCVFLFSVVVLALITYRTLAQDVGFPIETDEKKDQQNAMVSFCAYFASWDKKLSLGSNL